jgi:hypothetical protein
LAGGTGCGFDMVVLLMREQRAARAACSDRRNDLPTCGLAFARAIKGLARF